MALSLRTILLLVAVILFLLAALDIGARDWIAWGLAVFAAAFLVAEAGLDRRFGGTRT
jgi:predicted cobalt transporter CbtA